MHYDYTCVAEGKNTAHMFSFKDTEVFVMKFHKEVQLGFVLLG